MSRSMRGRSVRCRRVSRQSRRRQRRVCQVTRRVDYRSRSRAVHERSSPVRCDRRRSDAERGVDEAAGTKVRLSRNLDES